MGLGAWTWAWALGCFGFGFGFCFHGLPQLSVKTFATSTPLSIRSQSPVPTTTSIPSLHLLYPVFTLTPTFTLLLLLLPSYILLSVLFNLCNVIEPIASICLLACCCSCPRSPTSPSRSLPFWPLPGNHPCPNHNNSPIHLQFPSAYLYSRLPFFCILDPISTRSHLQSHKDT